MAITVLTLFFNKTKYRFLYGFFYASLVLVNPSLYVLPLWLAVDDGSDHPQFFSKSIQMLHHYKEHRGPPSGHKPLGQPPACQQET